MKKLNILITFIVLAALVLAQPPVPAPVKGTISVDGVPLVNQKIIVENKGTGEILDSEDVSSLKTNNQGGYAFDLSQFKDGYLVKDRNSGGDFIKITACTVSPDCVYEYELLDTIVKRIDFRIGVTEPVPTYVCPDGSIVLDRSNCPIKPPPPITPTPTPSPTEPIVCEDRGWQDIGVGAVIGLIVALVAFFGGGLKIYKSRTGMVKTQHKHRGIRGYHNPSISHRNKAYQHRRYKKDPLGCMMDVAKIEKEGHL